MAKFSVTTSVSFGSSASATLTSSLKRHGKKNTRVMQSTGKPLQAWVSSLVAPRVRFHAYQLPPDIPHMSGTASSANNCKREAGGTLGLPPHDPRPTAHDAASLSATARQRPSVLDLEAGQLRYRDVAVAHSELVLAPGRPRPTASLDASGGRGRGKRAAFETRWSSDQRRRGGQDDRCLKP